jgi:RNA polymerase sigma factor (sigma-70 family)
MATSVRLGVPERNLRLAEPGLMRDVEAAVRRRVRSDEADDVLQATWTDVLQATEVPNDPEEFRRFVFGVARHKVFDHFRRRSRELPSDFADDAVDAPEPLSARDVLRWAEGTLPDSESKHTLEWMLREGDGEKLEHIARSANLPAPRVRQRVSRLRRFLRQRWARELLLGAVLIGVGAYVLRTQQAGDQRARPEPVREDSPRELAQKIRRRALDRCSSDAQACIEALDRAKALDPIGDGASEVVAARRSSNERLHPTPTPSLELPSPKPSFMLPSPKPSPAPRPTASSTPPNAPRTKASPARRDKKTDSSLFLDNEK